jgi:hypothetical protein
VAGRDELLRRARLARVQADRAGLGTFGVVGQPLRGARGVGHVLLVEHFQSGLVAGELGQDRISAGARKPRVEQLDDHVDVLDALADGLAREVHVPRKPLNSHRCACFRSFALRGGPEL